MESRYVMGDSNLARIGESICGTCSVERRELTYDNQKGDGQSKKIGFAFDCLRGVGMKFDSLLKSRVTVSILCLYFPKRRSIARSRFGRLG